MSQSSKLTCWDRRIARLYADFDLGCNGRKLIDGHQLALESRYFSQ